MRKARSNASRRCAASFSIRRSPSTAAASSRPPALPLPDKPSIAVLPFANLSGDPEQEYFVDGMVEEIITALSRIRWLFVIARNSSFSYKGQSPDVKQVGRELGVRYVLEGSVRKAGRENSEKLIAMPNAWAWLSLFFYESTLTQKNGRWFTGDRSRHLVQTIQGRKQDQSHRHLVKSAVTNVLRFGKFAEVLMGSADGQSNLGQPIRIP
jgi:hypothetical protein